MYPSSEAVAVICAPLAVKVAFFTSPQPSDSAVVAVTVSSVVTESHATGFG
jgi:hypothetical protein